ncbi:PQQ-dependent sugar dehydrogenase [Streptomyces sp. NPDC047130]|uniref:PQQ-dependent sugar dehydrogenase n=1 Tax=Streptomyces sp. NPDC047130 TaxID=3155261 RepID=UPI0033D21D4F
MRSNRRNRQKRFNRAVALLGGALLACTSLTLATGPAGAAPAAPAAEEAQFQQVTLAKGVEMIGEPMSLAVLPDRSVLTTSRDGSLYLTDDAGNTSLAGRLDVYSHDEEGLQGIAVDPDFEQNRYVYLYYAPRLDTPEGDAPETGTAADFEPFEGVNRLSRFTLDEDGTLDLGSEANILEVETTRGICCHVGGDIDFDAQGNLYLSTGDDSNPFQSDGYSPLDDRENRNPSFDARRTSGNTDDLRGKILRITVNEDGSYSIPEGNLFAPGTEGTRPEIYAMGFRNPYRFNVDRETGILYVGDYGPDAGAADPERGPAGQVEFARVTGPGNFGWPFCTGDNDAYRDHDFATGTSGEAFDCAAPVNDSRHNTGLRELPPAQPAWIAYDGGSVPEFGTGSESPMSAPVYHYDPDLDSPVKFPEEFDGDVFVSEFGRQWIKRVTADADGTVRSINDLPWDGTQITDMEFGPDGALYVLDYGLQWFAGDENSALYRIENATGGRSPLAEATASVTSGKAPLKVSFSSEGTADPDGDRLTYRWEFGDGGTSTAPNPRYTYRKNGTWTAKLTVTDPTGRTAKATVRVVVGNTAPKVELVTPGDGELFSFGDAIPFQVKVTDREDGRRIDCSKVTVTFILGHDSHGHPLTSANGCTGTLRTTADGGHDASANVFGVVDAQYTDGGGGGQAPLTVHDQVVLQPENRQAEHYGDSSGVNRMEKEAAHGGRTVGDINAGDWISFTPYDLSEATSVTARVSSAGAGGTLEFRAGSPTGTLLGTATVPVTGGWDTFTDVTADLSGAPDGATELHLVFQGEGTGALYDVDDFTFTTG